MSNGPEFFQTQMGYRFYQNDVPRIANALEKIADRLEAEDVSKKADIYHDFGNGRVELNSEFAGQLMDVVEDFLESKGVVIENPEKTDSDDPAIIYGTDYDTLMAGFTGIIKNWIPA